MDVAEDATIRDAHPADHDDVVAMTADTWPDRPGDDYLPRVFPEWIADDGRPKRTRVVEVDGRAVAIAQAVMLTDDEGWGQGLRVHPEFRRHGLSRALTVDLFDWVREAGAAVMRALVFGWNGAGLGQSRATGYRPLGAFRWVHPEPAGGGVAREAARRQPGVDPDAVSVVDDPTAAWHARDVGSGALGGLALSMDESWALSEL
ncbi:MAG: N-acetyltransferase family protein, partial [Halobacteriales archaeon]